MTKRIICAALVAAVALAAGCSCAGNNTNATEPEKTRSVSAGTNIGAFAHYLTKYNWINEKSGDTVNFENSGEFEGKIDGREYRGKFAFEVNKDVDGQLDLYVTLDGETKKRPYTVLFSDSSTITITTDKGKSEKYIADWAIDNSN